MTHRPLYCVLILVALAFAGCAIPVDAPVSVAGNARDYFWPAGSDRLRYDVYNGLNTTPIEHTVTLTYFGDTIRAVDQALGNTGHFTSAVHDVGVQLTEIESTSLFPMPPGAYISRYSSEQYMKHYLPVSNFLYLKSTAIAFSDTTFTSSDKITWKEAISSFPDHITATCALSEKRIYIGSATGNLYFTENGGSTWSKVRSQMGGPVRAILSDSGVTYLAIEGVGVFTLEGSSFSEYRSSDLPTNVVGLVMLPTAFGGKKLIAATSNLGLVRTFTNGNEPWAKVTSTIDGFEMRGIYADDVNVLVTMASGDYYTSTDTAKTWHRAKANLVKPEERFTAGDVSFERATMATNKGRVFVSKLTDPSPQQIASMGAEIHAVEQVSEGQFVTASELGMRSYATSGLYEDVGPYGLEEDTARGPFALLMTGPTGQITTGSSWKAGNLHLSQSPLPTKYFEITARVMEQLDSLKVDEESFGDVFVIRYSYEYPTGTPLAGSPYWMIYFSRGIGPVMIDRISDENNVTSPISRAVYRTKR